MNDSHPWTNDAAKNVRANDQTEAPYRQKQSAVDNRYTKSKYWKQRLEIKDAVLDQTNEDHCGPSTQKIKKRDHSPTTNKLVLERTKNVQPRKLSLKRINTGAIWSHQEDPTPKEERG